MDMDEWLEQAKDAVESGNKARALELLAEGLEAIEELHLYQTIAELALDETEADFELSGNAEAADLFRRLRRRLEGASDPDQS